jgi:hypothetical protein
MMPPSEFAAEVSGALARNDRAYLFLLSMEAEGLPWETEGKQLTRKALDDTKLSAPTDEVMLFTGHRIDSPDRSQPRFPPEFEGVARNAILEMLTREKQSSRVIGVAGGANGGDILFLEACRELDIPFQMLLALPEDQFIAASVASAGDDWIARFKSLAQMSPPHVMASSKALPTWLKDKPGYSFWQRNNLWMIACALALEPRRFVLAGLWDGKQGDGGGGTQHMVEVAQKEGAQFIHLDTRRLFHKTTRTGAP